jgi:hypothetical protein
VEGAVEGLDVADASTTRCVVATIGAVAGWVEGWVVLPSRLSFWPSLRDSSTL